MHGICCRVLICVVHRRRIDKRPVLGAGVADDLVDTEPDDDR